MVTRLRDALAKLGTRVIDTFKQWDANSDGVISREEFHEVIPKLGLQARATLVDHTSLTLASHPHTGSLCASAQATAANIDKLFSLFDPDRSGTIDYRELNAQLRKGTSFNRAIMRTSTSLPSLTDHRPPPIPQPSRRVGDSRIHRVVIAK